MTSDIGLIGLGVMGQNLALNFADNGATVSVYNRTTSVTDEFVAGEGDRPDIVPFHYPHPVTGRPILIDNSRAREGFADQ